MLADELDKYKGRENKYVDDNIKEIQGLYTRNQQDWTQNQVLSRVRLTI